SNLEVLDLAGDLGAENRCVKACHPPDARTPLDDIIPSGFDIIAYGRYDAQSGYDDTSFHIRLLKMKGADSWQAIPTGIQRGNRKCLATNRPRARRRRAAAGTSKRLLLAVRGDVVHRLLHRRDLFGFLVRDFGFEFVLEGHHKLDHVERIGTEVVKEGRFVLDLGFVDAELLSDDLLDALFDAFHACSPVRKNPANYSQMRWNGQRVLGQKKN